jgi:acyl carrier protein
MDQATVLDRMKAHFEGQSPPEVLARFSDVRAMDMFAESIDVVNFLFYLEDELGPKIDASRIGPSMANMTFGELATKLCQLINGEKPVGP